MTQIRRIVTRSLGIFMSVALVNASVPMSAVITYGKPAAESVKAEIARSEAESKAIAKRRAKSATRLLTAKERNSLQGSSGENPYLAGQNKWDVIYKGINLMSGNFSTSATDMSFEGGYGIPVNVTRSYSANSMDQGPFGKGWTLSADVRSTAGGILKSSNAPVRSVPLTVRERPRLQLDDPNAVMSDGSAGQPVEAVIATDAGGQDETIQKDVDGILTTPPWDKNTSKPVYEFVTLNGIRYQVLVSNLVTTPDGTVYTYAKHGSYPSGTRPWNDPSATPEASNVLKVTSATDRQGNVTTYTYGSNNISFVKSNGTVSEHPLTGVQMPNGHTISFIWGNGTTGHPTNRIWKVQDNNAVRVVTYGYSSSGLLTSVTTPGGKTTKYGYGSAWSPAGWADAVASDLLTTVTSPQGLVSTIRYAMDYAKSIYGGNYGVAAKAYLILNPNGTYTYRPYGSFFGSSGTWPFWQGPSDVASQLYLTPAELADYAPDGTKTGWYVLSASVFSGLYVVKMQSLLATLNFNFDHVREYELASQNLMSETVPNQATASLSKATARKLLADPNFLQTVTTNKTYNFMGNPLSQTVLEKSSSLINPVWTTTRTATVSYAYWGKEKYFLQKAVQDQAGRFSYTDYYDSSAAAGKRGQTYRVYDPKHANLILDSNLPIPAIHDQNDVWKYQYKPSNPNAYSAQFDYDVKGRPVDVWKLQKDTTSPWEYVQTHTTYGSDSDGSWGQANTVVEDYGGINRTTQNQQYTSWGKADQVLDAAGRIFTTSYDLDGQVDSVTKTEGGVTVPVVTYTYGSTPPVAGQIDVTYGQPLSVTDNLSGVSQSFTYAVSGGGLGQTTSVTESGGGNPSYTTSYTYSTTGERQTTTYSTPNGTTRWGYFDYVALGNITSPVRPFETLAKLDANGNRTGEEFHYAYDSAGRLLGAAFAQTPTGTTAPSGGGSWYESSPASSRARASYSYDAGGRILGVEHYWDKWNGGSFTSEAILANSCQYEVDNVSPHLNRGLKTQSKFWTRSAPGSSTFTPVRTEIYGYDPNFDYLTSANYGDGLPNATPAWTYDAAGNRDDAVTDHLNRATSLGGVTVTHDILGNRLTKGSTTYTWDALNRMTSLNNGSVTTSYAYRADGLRILKSSSSGSTIYRYIGQMGSQDVELDGSGALQTVTDYAIGARGIDAISATTSASTVVSYPIYDAHGNIVSTLSKGATNTFSWSPERGFDAWGGVRSGSATGDIKGRHCANLGHKQDDESGLIYMRARYCEPTIGRFLSQDGARDGLNYYVYCANKPTAGTDPNGNCTLMDCLVSGMISALFSMGMKTGSQLVSGGIQALNLYDIIWAGFKGFMLGFALGGLAAGARALEIKQITSALAFMTSAKDLGMKLFMAYGVGGAAGMGDSGMDALRGPGKAVAAALGRNIQIGLQLMDMDSEE